ILLREQFGLVPVLEPFPIDSQPESTTADAILMIGDRAMQRPRGPFVCEWDLGDAWCRWSELPFVFAMWVARREVTGAGDVPVGELAEVAALLNQARDLGVTHVEEIAAAEHAAVQLSYDDCLTYLRDHLHFHLGPRELAGLRLFHQHAARNGLAPQKS